LGIPNRPEIPLNKDKASHNSKKGGEGVEETACGKKPTEIKKKQATIPAIKTQLSTKQVAFLGRRIVRVV